MSGARAPGGPDRSERLNVLIHDAGVRRDSDFTSGTGGFPAGENEARTDLEAPILLSALRAPLIAGTRPAAIINVSCGLGLAPAARMPVCSATQAGLHAVGMALRRPRLQIGLEHAEFAAVVMAGLAADVAQIGCRVSADRIRASRRQIDRRFEQMNGPCRRLAGRRAGAPCAGLPPAAARG